MPSVPSTILVATLWSASEPSAACADPFADPDRVLDLHLRTTSATWEALEFDEPVEGEECAQYPWHAIEFRCGTSEPWITIGARHKRGDQRGRDTDEKPPLKLDFNRVDQAQAWPAALGDLGFRKLSLNNGQPNDPGSLAGGLMSEPLAWRVMGREIANASRSAYARVWVHLVDGAVEPEYHGLYLLLEDVDRAALRRRFGDDHGRLAKYTASDCDGVDFDDGPPNQANDGYLSWAGLQPAYYEGDWLERTEQAFELDELLRQEAIRIVLGDYDGILGRNNNYYAWDPVLGRRHYLPWDLDWALDPLLRDEATPIGKCDTYLARRTVCTDAIRARYLDIVCELVEGSLSASVLLDEIDRVDALVRPLLAEEVESVWGGRDVFASTGDTYETRLARARAFVPARIDNVLDQLAAEGRPCGTPDPDGGSTTTGGDDGEASTGEPPGTTAATSSTGEPPVEDPEPGSDTASDTGESTTGSGSGGVPEQPDGSAGCGCAGAPGATWPAWLPLVIGRRRLRARLPARGPRVDRRSTGSDRARVRRSVRPRSS